MRLIIALDPGDKQTAMVAYDPVRTEPVAFALEDNNTILNHIYDLQGWIGTKEPLAPEFAIEMIASYGMPVGRTVFDTCIWIGRFMSAVLSAGYPQIHRPKEQGILPRLIVRKDVKMHLCGSNRAKDANVTQAIVDRYGGTMPRAKGTKTKPGPLYGFKKDIWAAMGVAITAAETDCYYTMSSEETE